MGAGKIVAVGSSLRVAGVERTGDVGECCKKRAGVTAVMRVVAEHLIEHPSGLIRQLQGQSLGIRRRNESSQQQHRQDGLIDAIAGRFHFLEKVFSPAIPPGMVTPNYLTDSQN